MNTYTYPRKYRYNKNDFLIQKEPKEPSIFQKFSKEALFLLFFIGLTIFVKWLYKTDPGGTIEKVPNLFLIACLAATGVAFYVNIKDQDNQLKSPLFQTTKYITLIVCLAILCSVIVPKIVSSESSASKWVQNTQLIIYTFISAAFLFLLMNLLLFIYAIRRPDIMDESTTKSYRSFIFKTLSYYSLVSFAIIFLILLITFFVSVVSTYSSTTAGRWIISIFIVLIISYLFFKVFSMTSFYKKSLLIQFIFDCIFYIPCFVINSVNAIAADLTNTKMNDWVWLCVGVFLLLVYIFYGSWEKKRYSSHGKQLVNMPIELNQEHTLGTFDQIGGSAYQHAVSFWFFLDAYPPNYNKEAKRYMSMINNGSEPNVYYKASENALYFTMRKTVPGLEGKEEKDDHGNIVVYKLKNITYQKWNHVVINYSGGTLDIFYNNVLKQSVPGVVPYMNYDSLTIGENGGIYGSICNVVYFHEALNINKINELYEAVYKKTPPVLKVDDNTIIKPL